MLKGRREEMGVDLCGAGECRGDVCVCGGGG